ncbi:DNA-binding protein [Candidatus Woesearchaeota archaeon]|nr:DNA-binding protein [Candidatus Woesearchaeota archaeon]
MKFKELEKNRYFIMLENGEEIIESLTKFLAANKITSGFFTAIGAVEKVELGYFFQKKKQYRGKVIEQEMEVVSLNGNITSMDNKPYIHAHAVLSDENMQTYAGHLKFGIVGPTLEIILIAFNANVKKKFNEKVGLNVLDESVGHMMVCK